MAGAGGSPQVATTGRRAACVALLLMLVASLLVMGAGPGAATASNRAETQPQDADSGARQAQEVRTVWTGELGVARPTGLAYDPGRQELLVAGDQGAGTRILRLGPDEDVRGRLRLPAIDSPQTLTFDEANEQLIAVDGEQRVEVPAQALTRARPPAEQAPLDDLPVSEPASAAVDPETGTWFLLEEGADAVTAVTTDDPSDVVDETPLPPAPGERIIAFNPADELLYVLDEERRRLDAVDRDGTVAERIDLSAIDLTEPVAMTFGHSSDPTDDADALNLFIADTGNANTLGSVTEVSLAAVAALVAPIDVATLKQTIPTSAWNPAAPDPAGIVWLPAADELAVTDSEVDEETGAGWHNVNFWRSSRTGSVIGTGTWWGPSSAGSFSREPTGLGFDASSNTLFVSDDSARRVFVVKTGGDGQFGTTDDVVTSISTSALGSTDTEDPEYDPVSGDLFILDGVGREIYRVDPVDGVFGNGNDVSSSFDISHLGPSDFEGLTSNPDRRTLYVGARATEDIFEITHDGTLVRTISASSVSDLRFISGLGMAPASDGSGQMSLWIVDRAVDNGANSNENDGKIFEISAPDIGGPIGNIAPSAVDDSATTEVDTPVTVPVLDNDLDANGDPLSVTNLTQPDNGTAQLNPDDTVTYTPDDGFLGTDTFTYTANDGQADSNVATVTVTVLDDTPVGPAPVFRSASSAIVTGASGTTLTIPRPAGVQAGDLLLAQIRHRSLTTLTPPAGWTHLATIERSTAHHGVYYKIAGSSEPASYIFDQGNSGGRMAGGIGAYTGVHQQTPIDAWAASAVDTPTLVAPNATATVDNTMVVRLWGWRGPSATDSGVGFNTAPAGVTERWSQQSGHSNDDRNRVLAGDHVQAAAGPVGTSTASGSASSQENRRSSFTVILRPAASSEPPPSEPPPSEPPPSEPPPSEPPPSEPPANTPPVATDDTASTDANTPVVVNVLANDSDADNDPLSVTNLTQPDNGTAQVNPDESVTYTPDAGFDGTDTFTYTANDGLADSNAATVTVTVAPDDPPPTGEAPVFRSAASAAVTKASGAILTIARPAGVQAGDLLLAQIRHRTLTTLTPPAGWTHLGTIDNYRALHSVYYKIAGASEPASYAFDQGNDGGRMAGGIGAYTGVDPANPIDAWAASAVDTPTLVAPNATATVDNTMVVRLWGWRGPSATDSGVGFNTAPAGVTERWSQQVVHSNDDRNRVLAGDHVQETAGPVGTSTASGSASSAENRRNAFTVILRPAGG